MSAGPGAQPREGFKRLLASVAMGEVGMVLCSELSRLSRTDKDWCHLMELCQLFDTLIADADNLYDPNRLDDQLILGIKGTLSKSLNLAKFRIEAVTCLEPDGLRYELIESLQRRRLHCEIGFDVEVRRRRVLVTKPQGDDVDIDTGLEQVHGARVAKRVG